MLCVHIIFIAQLDQVRMFATYRYTVAIIRLFCPSHSDSKVTCIHTQITRYRCYPIVMIPLKN